MNNTATLSRVESCSKNVPRSKSKLLEDLGESLLDPSLH
jgi:hypothetical protein